MENYGDSNIVKMTILLMPGIREEGKVARG